MQTRTVDQIANHNPHGTSAGVYVWRDGNVVFYVGQSNDVQERLLSYLGLGSMAHWGYGTALYSLLRENFPAARNWQIDVYAPEEILPNRDSQGIVSTSYLQEAEDVMIHRLRPCLNATNNKNGQSLPAKYAKEKLANAGVRFGRQ